MAESAVLSGLLKALFEKLASGAQQQLGKMLGVPRELEKLQSTLTIIQSVLQDAEEKEVKDATLRNWLEKLKNAAYDADDVLDEAHYELLWWSADIHHGFKNKIDEHVQREIMNHTSLKHPNIVRFKEVISLMWGFYFIGLEDGYLQKQLLFQIFTFLCEV